MGGKLVGVFLWLVLAEGLGRARGSTLHGHCVAATMGGRLVGVFLWLVLAEGLGRARGSTLYRRRRSGSGWKSWWIVLWSGRRRG